MFILGRYTMHIIKYITEDYIKFKNCVCSTTVLRKRMPNICALTHPATVSGRIGAGVRACENLNSNTFRRYFGRCVVVVVERVFVPRF